MIVHGDKLRWLAWLRMRMFLRGFRRRPGMLVFSLIGLVFLLFLAGLLALALFSAFQNLSAPANTEILYLLFTGALLFWIVMPMLSYSTNEGLDVSKLQLFPLTRPEVMFSLLFSSLFDIWTVFLFVLFATTIVAWWLNSFVLGLMSLLVILVFYVVMVSISQLILALLMRTLQSRRFRDLSVIIIALFGSSCYIASRLVANVSGYQNIGSMLQNGGFSHYLQWLPSGVAAGAIRDAAQGNWGSGFALLGVLVLIGLLALYLWQLLLERSMTASETGAARSARTRKKTTPAYQASIALPVAAPQGSASAISPISASAVPQASVSAVETATRARSGGAEAAPVARLFKANLGEQLQALVRKEWICLWRDPQLKIRLFQPLIYIAVFIVLPSLGVTGGKASGDSFYNTYMPFVAAAIVFFFLLTLSQNTLGIERESLTTLFLFPVDRRRLLWGKNLALFLPGFLMLVVLLVACAILGRSPDLILPAAVIGLSGMAVALSWGNFASSYFPRYQPQIGKRGYQATGGQAQNGGCLTVVMSLVMTLVTIIALAPVALGIGIPFFLNISWLLALTIPLSLVYGIAFYIILTNLSARRILATEPEILAMTTRE